MSKTTTKTATGEYEGGSCVLRDVRPASITIADLCREYEEFFGVPITIDKISRIELNTTPVLASELDRLARVLSAMTGREITLNDLWKRSETKDG